jgi:hypothetical protein
MSQERNFSQVDCVADFNDLMNRRVVYFRRRNRFCLSRAEFSCEFVWLASRAIAAEPAASLALMITGAALPSTFSK